MSAITSATPAISIDVLHDLDSDSALTKLLDAGQTAIFQIAGQLLTFAARPIGDAAAANVSAQFNLTTPAGWTLPNGIALSIAAGASCAISINTVSETFSVATRLESDDTADIVVGPRAGVAYINIDLDFNIRGNVFASGSFNGPGITGTASGGRSATITFCQPVSDSVLTLDAIKQALSQIIFPLDPTRIRTMRTGSLTRVLFDGAFSAELDVTFGLGDHKFAAPGVAAALASAQKVVSIIPPSVEINAGATGSVTFTHADHFALLIDKSADTLATVYLLRALASDAGVTAGFTANITTSAVSIALDPAALHDVVKQVTGSELLAAAVVNEASIPLNNLETSLNVKLENLAVDVTGQITATAGLARQHDRTALFVFDADLTSPDLLRKSWTALISGNIKDALTAGGLTLQPGSGIYESLKRAATFHFQFFNLFRFDSVSDFFCNATAELGPDGTVRLHAAIGDEASSATKKSFSSFRIYFVVAATGTTAGAVATTGVDLRIELSESNKQQKGSTFAGTLSLAPAATAIDAAKNALGTYLGGHPGGKVTVLYDIKSSAYSRLTCSPYTGKKPGPLPHAEDQANWTAFHDATSSLVPDLAFVAPLTYPVWMKYNRACIDQPGSTVVPDRRHTGDSAAGLAVLANSPTRQLAGFFLQASQGFMNLCEDLRTLADEATAANDFDHYNSLLAFVTTITTRDVFIDYAVPTAGAVLRLCTVAEGTRIASTVNLLNNGSAITCTLTLS